MSQENVEVVRSLYEAWNSGDYAALRQKVDPEIEVEVALGGSFDGRYRGLAAAEEPVAEFWTNFGSQHTEIEECVTQGDEVAVGVRLEGRGKHSGAEVEWRIAHVWTLRRGKIVRWRLFKTMQDALEAAGLSE
jgi:hypothetical protein